MRGLKMILTVALGLTVLAAFATHGGGFQQKTVQGNAMKKPSKAAIYACPKCEVASYATGNCKACGAKMEKINATAMFACDKCHTTSASTAKCPKCGGAMKRVAKTYACEQCHETALVAGKCPKCGMAMQKHLLPMKT